MVSLCVITAVGISALLALIGLSDANEKIKTIQWIVKNNKEE